MVVHNEFLLYGDVHNNLRADCFCGNCRHLRVVNFSVHTNAELYDLVKNRLPERDDIRLYKYHRNVLDTIAASKVYKDSSLENSGYKYFKSWAKNQAAFATWDAKQLDQFCQSVNEACVVFDNWDKICRNLTDSRMDQIDARRFSVRYFYLSKSLDWCLTYNEQLRKKGKRSDEPRYPEDKYQEILQHIIASGILTDTEPANDPHVAAMLGGRLQSDLVRICRTRQHQPLYTKHSINWKKQLF